MGIEIDSFAAITIAYTAYWTIAMVTTRWFDHKEKMGRIQVELEKARHITPTPSPLCLTGETEQ